MMTMDDITNHDSDNDEDDLKVSLRTKCVLSLFPFFPNKRNFVHAPALPVPFSHFPLTLPRQAVVLKLMSSDAVVVGGFMWWVMDEGLQLLFSHSLSFFRCNATSST